MPPLGADGASCSPGFAFSDLPGYLVCCLLLILDNLSPLSLQIFLLPPLACLGTCAPRTWTFDIVHSSWVPFLFVLLFSLCVLVGRFPLPFSQARRRPVRSSAQAAASLFYVLSSSSLGPWISVVLISCFS